MSLADEARVLPEVNMTDELAAAVKAAMNAADMRALIVAEAEKQLATKTQLDADQAAATQAAADKVAADQAAADAVAKANQIFTRAEIIGGQEFHFSASTEGELDRQVLNAFKVAYNVQPPAAEPVAVVDPEAAAKAAEAEVLAKTELERKFKLGEISAADYIQQSGAVNEYLSAQGLSVESLKAIVEDKKAAAVTQSWQAASETFRNGVGADWPGGENNRILLGDKLAALGLTDAEDKVAAMAQAWTAMKATGAYFKTGDEPVTAATVVVDTQAAEKAVLAADAAKAAAAADAARVAAATAKTRATSSSMFGASSGTSGAPVVSPAVIEAKKVVPNDATPAEILQAWKDAQVAGGQNPDAVFMEQYGAKKI